MAPKHPEWRGKLLALCLLTAVLFCVPALARVQDQDALAPVPAALRASLAERLKLLVEYHRTQQWEKQYDLLSVAYTQGVSQEEYTERNRRWSRKVVPDDLILDFTPRAATVHESSEAAGWWTIEGCAKLRKKGRVVELYAAVEAHRESGTWYFSDVGVITPIDGPPRPCPYPDIAVRNSQRCSAAGGKKN